MCGVEVVKGHSVQRASRLWLGFVLQLTCMYRARTPIRRSLEAEKGLLYSRLRQLSLNSVATSALMAGAVTCFVALTPRLIAVAKLLAYLATASLHRSSIVAPLGGMIVGAHQRNALFFN